MTDKFVRTLIARFDGLDDLDVIKQKVVKIPTQQNDLNTIPEYQIRSHIGDLLNEIYIPTSQDLALLKKLVQTARAHCNSTYQSGQQYMEGLYTHYTTFKVAQQFPICLTGPAGVGKTALFLAMQRLFPRPTEENLGVGHGIIPIQSHWYAQVQQRSTIAELLAPFIPTKQCAAKNQTKRTIPLSTKNAFKSGVSLFMLDELQFLTQSSQANTAITKLLYNISFIGIPFVFVANYSLCALLLRRPEQDRQRLLSSPVILLSPSNSDCPDWGAYLQALQHVLGESLKIDLQQERHTLYTLTAGLKRLVGQLLKLTYDLAWQNGQRHVTLADLRTAYDHTEYAVSRTQAETMLSPYTKKSSEYTCPFPLPKVAAAELIRTQDRMRSKQIIDSIQRDALSQNEKKKLGITEQPKAKKASKRGKLTVNELRQANASWLNSGSTQ